MPIISFTPKDKMAAVTLEAGYQTVTIEEIDGPKGSKSGQSINWFTRFIVSGGKYAGKELTVCFNSGMSSASVLGDLQFMPQHMMLAVKAAIDKVPLKDVKETFDTDELLHKPLDIKVDVHTADSGGLINIVTLFLPEGTGAAAKTPF